MTAHAAERPVSTSAAPPSSTAGTTISGFLLKLAHVSEDLVTLAPREALSASTSHCVLQAPDHLDEDHAIRIAPDSSTTPTTAPRTPRPDAKYKAENPEGFPDSDLHQMLAYCTAPVSQTATGSGSPASPSTNTRSTSTSRRPPARRRAKPRRGLLPQTTGTTQSR